jgi:His/Glu/Gln/Arg/opine family amino acid ABC transporter permease subunit
MFVWDFIWETISPYLPWLTEDAQQRIEDGVLLTAIMTLVTSSAALVLGVMVNRLRLSPWWPLRQVGRLYIETFRNIPALVLVLLFAFGLPNAFDADVRRELFFQSEAMLYLREQSGEFLNRRILIPYYAVGAMIGITLNTSAYLAEILRAGVASIPQRQLESARLLGASTDGAYLRFVLPHSIRRMSPAIITRLVHNMKNTTLASFVAVPEFYNAIYTIITRTFQAIDLIIFAIISYIILSIIFAALLWLLLPNARRYDAVP